MRSAPSNAPRRHDAQQPNGAAAPGVEYSAHFQQAIELIGKRWTGSVIRALLRGRVRYNALLGGIPGISDRVLTERLRELVREGLAERLVDPGPPVRVDYRLTERGHLLGPVVAAIDGWVGEAE